MNVCLVTQSYLTLCDSMDFNPPGSSVYGDSPGKNTGVVSMLSSGWSSQPRDWTQIFHIAGRFFTYLSHQGSPRMLEWVAYPFSRRSPWPRNWTGVSDPASQADSLPNSSKRQGQKVISTPLTYLSTYIVIGVHSHWSAGELFMVFTLKEFIT